MAIMLIQRSDFIRNNVANTKTKIRNCAGSKSALTQLLRSERSLAAIYKSDGARDTARIIETECIPLIEDAMKVIPPFAQIGKRVMQGKNAVSECRSNTFALRVVNALNRYTPGSRGY